MREQLTDIVDRIPRWGELSTTQRVITSAAALVVVGVIVVTSLWGAGVIGGSDSNPTPAAAPSTGPSFEGLPECNASATGSDTDDPDALILATDDRGLPYRAGAASAQRFTSAGGTVLRINVCMPEGATEDQLKDVATIVAENIKAGDPQQATIDLFSVANVGSGNESNGSVVTRFKEHTFTKGENVYAQRSAWDYTPG